jgi:hypothetical protein
MPAPTYVKIKNAVNRASWQKIKLLKRSLVFNSCKESDLNNKGYEKKK